MSLLTNFVQASNSDLQVGGVNEVRAEQSTSEPIIAKNDKSLITKAGQDSQIVKAEHKQDEKNELEINELANLENSVLKNSISVNETNYISLNSEQNKTYTTLKDAVENAQENDVLNIHGEIKMTEKVVISKNLQIQAENGKIVAKGTNINPNDPTTYALYFLVNSGKTLILGSGKDGDKLLLEEVHVKVTKGNLHFQSGVQISSQFVANNDDARQDNLEAAAYSSIVALNGSESSATFTGGIITNPVTDYGVNNNNVAVRVANGAKVEQISGGAYMSWGSAWKVTGKGTSIGSISGGEFKNSKHSGLSDPCFLLEKEAKITAISGGYFQSYSFGALQLESGAEIKTISGGKFINDYTTTSNPSSHSGAKPFYCGLVLYGRNGNSVTKIEEITGGTFTGINGLLAVGNEPKQKVVVNKIIGGTFNSLTTDDGNAALYFTQNSEVGELSGSLAATGKNVAIWNAGTIDKIAGGTYTGDYALINKDLTANGDVYKYFKGNISEISGGTFKANNFAISNNSIIGKITGGIFAAELQTASTYNRDKATIFNKNTNQAILLEPDLTNSQLEKGKGRYLANFPVTQYENNQGILRGNIKLPTYTGADGTVKEYIMSGYNYPWPFKDPKQDPNEQRINNAYIFFRNLYIKTDNSEGALDRPNNDYYDASTGFNPQSHTVYGVSKNYTNDNYLDNGYRYLMKRPVLSYDDNFPEGAQTSGTVPQLPKDMKAFEYNSYSNNVPFINGEPETLFCVKDNIGNLTAQNYTFKGWNTQKDGKGIWLYAGQYVAMPAANLTLYAQWEGKGGQGTTPSIVVVPNPTETNELIDLTPHVGKIKLGRVAKTGEIAVANSLPLVIALAAYLFSLSKQHK